MTSVDLINLKEVKIYFLHNLQFSIFLDSEETITLKARPTDNEHYGDKSESLWIKHRVPKNFASDKMQNVLMDLWEFGSNNFNSCDDFIEIFLIIAF